MPIRFKSNIGPHRHTRKMSFTLSTKGILTTINPTIPAHMSPSTQFRGLNPNILLESSTLSGMVYSYSLSSFTALLLLYIFIHILYQLVYYLKDGIFSRVMHKKALTGYCFSSKGICLIIVYYFGIWCHCIIVFLFK